VSSRDSSPFGKTLFSPQPTPQKRKEPNQLTRRKHHQPGTPAPMISTITRNRLFHPRTISFLGRSPRRCITSVALLHQAIPPPLINGSFKPPKPGGSSSPPCIPYSQSTDPRSETRLQGCMRGHRLRGTLTKRPRDTHNSSSTTPKPGHRHRLVIPRYSTRYPGGHSCGCQHHLGKHPSIYRPPAHHYCPPTLHKTNRKPAKSSSRCRPQGLHEQVTPIPRLLHPKELAPRRRPEAINRAAKPASLRPPIPRHRQARSWEGQPGGSIDNRVCGDVGCPR